MNQLIFGGEQFKDTASGDDGSDGKDHQGLPLKLAADNGLGDTAGQPCCQAGKRFGNLLQKYYHGNCPY
jgi:hypothetical protein